MITEVIGNVDRRTYPRLTLKNPVAISGDFFGEVVNVSPAGLCVRSSAQLSKPTYKVDIHFPSGIVHLDLKVIWSPARTEMGEYGAEIINAEDDFFAQFITKYLVTNFYRNAIANIRDKNARRHILQFAKHLRDYLFNLWGIATRIGQAPVDEMKRAVQVASNDIVSQGEELKAALDSKVLIQQIQKQFRQLVSSFAFKSQIMKRGYDKPKGYPGDYRTLEIIYDWEVFSSPEELGYYFDMYFLENPYATAVRNRMHHLRESIRALLSEGDEREIKILNLASGSCREIRELFADESFRSSMQKQRSICFTFLDWDSDALRFSENEIGALPKNVQMTFLKEDLLNFIKTDEFFQRNGKHDFIYSIGLADYLPDRVLKRVIRQSFDGLKPGGSFLIAHKDEVASFSHLPPEWFCDWVFIPRDLAAVMDLIKGAGIEGYSHSISREPSDQVFFIDIKKNE